MTYFTDLTPYSYLSESPDAVVNVGWLDPEHPYERGAVAEQVLSEIFELCSRPVNRTRGYHLCPFCEVKQMGLPVTLGGKRLTLGSAEIRVSTPERTYAAPDLIFHYIRDHGYKPPDEFVRAVLATA